MIHNCSGQRPGSEPVASGSATLLTMKSMASGLYANDNRLIDIVANMDAAKITLGRWYVEQRSNGGEPLTTVGEEPKQGSPAPANSSSSRPTALKPRFEAIPAELTALPNWVLWKYEPPEKPGGKWRKVPYQPNGYKASTTNRHTWSTFETCCAVYEQGGYDGIGFCV